MSTKTFSEEEKAFYSDGYKIAQEIITNGHSTDSQFNGTKFLHDSIDKLNEMLLQFAQKHNTPVQCASGCAFCCHQPIFAATHEFQYLIEFLRKSIASEKIDQIRQSLEEINIELNNPHKHPPCPLLQDNNCMVYQVRPIACRIYLSTNLASCKNHFNNPQDNSSYPELLDLPLKAGRMMNQGFIAGLNSGGIENKEMTIQQGLSTYL